MSVALDESCVVVLKKTAHRGLDGRENYERKECLRACMRCAQRKCVACSSYHHRVKASQTGLSLVVDHHYCMNALKIIRTSKQQNKIRGISLALIIR